MWGAALAGVGLLKRGALLTGEGFGLKMCGALLVNSGWLPPPCIGATGRGGL